MRTSWDTEDVVQLFEGALLGLVQKEEDQAERDEVHAGVETECTWDTEGLELSREGDGDDGGPEVISCYSPGHADFSVREREHFCRVGEWHRSFSWGVECIVDVDEQCDQAKMSATTLGDKVAHACEEQTPAHVGKCKQEQGSTSKGVNGPDGGPGEEEIDGTKAEGGQECPNIACSSLDEDGGRIESDDIDCDR